MKDIEKKFVSIMMAILDEKERRIFLGSYSECLGSYSECLGYGGITELSQLTGVSRTTITEGRKNSCEIEGNPTARGTGKKDSKVRAAGAGRKPSTKKYPHIQEELYSLLDVNFQ